MNLDRFHEKGVLSLMWVRCSGNWRGDEDQGADGATVVGPVRGVLVRLTEGVGRERVVPRAEQLEGILLVIPHVGRGALVAVERHQGRGGEVHAPDLDEAIAFVVNLGLERLLAGVDAGQFPVDDVPVEDVAVAGLLVLAAATGVAAVDRAVVAILTVDGEAGAADAFLTHVAVGAEVAVVAEGVVGDGGGSAPAGGGVARVERAGVAVVAENSVAELCGGGVRRGRGVLRERSGISLHEAVVRVGGGKRRVGRGRAVGGRGSIRGGERRIGQGAIGGRDRVRGVASAVPEPAIGQVRDKVRTTIPFRGGHVRREGAVGRAAGVAHRSVEVFLVPKRLLDEIRALASERTDHHHGRQGDRELGLHGHCPFSCARASCRATMWAVAAGMPRGPVNFLASFNDHPVRNA